MRLSWILALTVAFLLILSLCATTVVSSTPNKEEKRFVSFHPAKTSTGSVNAGSFINVPVNCPPDKIKIGSRCRAVF